MSDLDIKRRDELAVTIKSIGKELTAPKAQVSKLQSEIDELSEQILSAGGVKLRAQKCRVDGIADQIKSVQEQMNRLLVEKGVREKAISKLTTSIAKREAEISTCTAELEELEEQIAAGSESMRALKAEADKISKETEVMEEQVNEMKQQLEQKSEGLNNLRSKEVSWRFFFIEIC